MPSGAIEENIRGRGGGRQRYDVEQGRHGGDRRREIGRAEIAELEQHDGRISAVSPGRAALSDFCHALFNSSEFLYIE